MSFTKTIFLTSCSSFHFLCQHVVELSYDYFSELYFYGTEEITLYILEKWSRYCLYVDVMIVIWKWIVDPNFSYFSGYLVEVFVTWSKDRRPVSTVCVNLTGSWTTNLPWCGTTRRQRLGRSTSLLNLVMTGCSEDAQRRQIVRGPLMESR